MEDGIYSEFLDLLYGAILAPERWIQVMERFADMVGGEMGWLSQLNLADGGGTGLVARIDPAEQVRYFQHYWSCNPFARVSDIAAYRRAWKPTIFTDEDWMPRETFVRGEYFNDFLRPQGIDSCMMVRLAVEGDQFATLNLSRPKRLGRFEADELALARRLHPHLIRAFNLTQQLGSMQRTAEDFEAAFDRSSSAVFFLDGGARIRYANRAAEELMAGPAGLMAVNGRLGAMRPDEARRIQELSAAASRYLGGPPRAGAVAIHSTASDTPIYLTLAPLGTAGPSVFDGGPTVLAHARLAASRIQAPEQRLRELFSLTQAEARVAACLLDGDSPKEIADRLSVSLPTVRAHLAHIFEKTGVRRQAELGILLSRVLDTGLPD